MSYNPAGKGDGKRPVNGEVYRGNYNNIFRKQNTMSACSRCNSHYPNASCYVCWIEPKEDDQDCDDATTNPNDD